MPRFLENQTDDKKEKLSGGEWLMKSFGKAGCIFVLLMAAVGIFICFTAGTDPIKGYEAPLSTEEYAASPAILKAELEENVFPHVEGVLGCEVRAGGVTVTLAEDSFVVTRAALLRYFDESLLELVKAPAE